MPSRKSFAALFRPLSIEASKSRQPVPPEDNPAIQAIWHVIATLPRGRVSTYGAVAKAAGLPGRARQTGYALRLSPPEMNLPWHRVLGAGGRIVFPKGSSHYKEQARLLRSEGVAVKDGRVDKSAIMELEEL